VGPEPRLSDADYRALARLPVHAGDASPLRIELVDAPPWKSEDRALFPEQGPAVVDWVEGRVRISHRTFVGEVDPFGRSGRLFRAVKEPFPLEILLRTAMAARLPLVGGLPLHAAGIVLEGRAVAFFGPSGAGKSTLAGLSPHPVLSDELVAVVPAGGAFALETTGFWGTLGQGNAPSGTFPLAAVVELGKGSGFLLERVPPRAALRRLVGVALVPPGPPLWAATLEVLGRLAAAVPAYRMSWTKDEPPFAEVRERLRRDASPIST
jgi:hypothetical protein